MPKLTKDIEAVKPGEVYPSVIKAGTDVDGRLAEIAEALGAIEAKKAKPLKNKAMKVTGDK